MYCTIPAESKEALEERLAMKEKNGSVLYIPEHKCWEEKGKIRKRPHSTDSLPESKKTCATNGYEGMPPLTSPQGMVVNVGYTKAPMMQPGGMTKLEPMVLYPSFGLSHADTAVKNHVKDTTSNTDAQMDSLKKRLDTTHSQLKAEREAKKELSRTVAKLQSELGTVKAHLADYRQRLEALQAFPSKATGLYSLECCTVELVGCALHHSTAQGGLCRIWYLRNATMCQSGQCPLVYIDSAATLVRRPQRCQRCPVHRRLVFGPV